MKAKQRFGNAYELGKISYSPKGGGNTLKGVVLAIPNFAMSCFKLLTILCMELERLMANFLWGQKNEEIKIHWVAWKTMCSSKFNGGLGFKDLYLFNLALQAKQG